MWLKDQDAVWKPAEVKSVSNCIKSQTFRLKPVEAKSICIKSKPFKSKVVTAYNGKSVEVEDEGGDRQTITVKDEQTDLPPLRWTHTIINNEILSPYHERYQNPDSPQESRHPDW